MSQSLVTVSKDNGVLERNVEFAISAVSLSHRPFTSHEGMSVSWLGKLCTTMTATDVSDTLAIALRSSGLERVRVRHRPPLLSDNGPSYLSVQLGPWLAEHGMTHTRGKPYHPMT
jgi:hypothetical protein